jgi:hypothetical protein
VHTALQIEENVLLDLSLKSLNFYYQDFSQICSIQIKTKESLKILNL